MLYESFVEGVSVEGDYIVTIVTIDHRIEPNAKSPSAHVCHMHVVYSVLEAHCMLTKCQI